MPKAAGTVGRWGPCTPRTPKFLLGNAERLAVMGLPAPYLHEELVLKFQCR